MVTTHDAPGALYQSIDVDRSGVTESTGHLAADYDALQPKGRRKAPPANVQRVDATVQTPQRGKLSANAQDIVNNLAIAGWMLRKHLDYCAQFEFQSQNDDEALNDDIEALMLRDSRPLAFDVAGRFPREKWFRLNEALRTVDGDVMAVKLRSGHLQGIKGDLVRHPRGMQSLDGRGRREWVNGVKINGVGRPLEYAVHRRGVRGRGYEYVRNISARNMLHYGFFDQFASDQVRGVSPIVAALNPLRDVYENFDYALVRSKVAQMFALAFYREADEAAGDITDEAEADEQEDKSGYKVDFGRGPVVLDLEPGDKAEFLESKSPSQELQQFTQLVIAVALKTLDIPYSFYDEGHTNFFGSRGAWLHYERSCYDKRQDQIELRRQYTIWKLQQWILRGDLRLPRSTSIADLAWEWIPKGMPWWDPAKEIKGDLMAIGAGLDTPQRITKARGTGNYRDNLRKIAEAIRDARSIGQEILGEDLQLSFAAPPDQPGTEEPTRE